MNHIFRVIWNQVTEAWQAVTEVARGHSKSNKTAKTVLMAGLGCVLGLAGAAHAELPTGGNIVAGSGSISSTGNTMTVVQTTDRMAANWQSFSIGQGKTVNFVQPSSSAVALNRVLGSDVSVIQGSINANGKIFLLNPNGVLFTPTAQVNVGSIVASTLSMSTADFMAGNYKFEGNSSNAIVNQGNITAAEGGTIALIAAKIINDGTLTANAGNVLLGAGSKVTLDLGGPVKLQVENDTLETLIANGGAIKANGGTVLLTSQAAANLASSVINNSGVIEAQTLASGQKGEIVLFAHGGTAHVGGKLDASAPNGGDGGFIETSASKISFSDDLVVRANAVSGKAGRWLIDPTDITIEQSTCTGTNCISANTIATTLNGGTDVTIETDAPGSDDYSQRGDINFNGNLTWNQSTLILRAHNDIWIRGNLTGSGSAKLGLEYGLGNANGKFYDSSYNFTEDTNASYTILGSLSLAAANSFYAYNAGDGTGSTNFADFVRVPVFLNNGLLRFGDGTKDSVDQFGSLLQPFYYNNTDKRWYKLTYSDSPMFLNVGWGLPSDSDITNYSVSNFSGGTIISNQRGKYDFSSHNFDGNASTYLQPVSVDETAYANGKGTLVSSNTISEGSITLTLQNTYILRPGVSYIEAFSKVTNVSGTSIDNVRLWSGTRDDYIGTTDGPLKQKGNISGGSFTPVVSTGVAANAVKVTSYNEGILFYSTSQGADTTVGSCCSPDFHIDSAGSGNPLNSPSNTQYSSPAFNTDYSNRASAAGYFDYSEDGNYSVFSNFGTLNNNAAKSIAWYYAAGPVANLTSIVSSVSAAAQQAVQSIAAAEGTANTPTVNTPTVSNIPMQLAIQRAAQQPTESGVSTLGNGRTQPDFAPTGRPPAQVTLPQQAALPVVDLSGGLAIVELTGAPATSNSGQAVTSSADMVPPIGITGMDPLGFMRVFVTQGGINMPSNARTDAAAENARRKDELSR